MEKSKETKNLPVIYEPQIRLTIEPFPWYTPGELLMLMLKGALDMRVTVLVAGDSQHRKLIEECQEQGHDWGPWEDVKFVTGSERQCKRCRLNTSDITGTLSGSYAIGGIWAGVVAVHSSLGLELPSFD